ncbi:hypothetical protein GCM10007874_50960 [Labrys miyagiensis]|uniref:Uncharacterized protein n=1 Tax=Labrys miyagiensis TaxID=346912 RepID=A0ABQ6CTL9_9HYPH|nr:hypothetical protein GCM10007874_50960 [Labrys miyagiensis]
MAICIGSIVWAGLFGFDLTGLTGAAVAMDSTDKITVSKTSSALDMKTFRLGEVGKKHSAISA